MPPPAKPPQPLKLTFTTTSLRNVTIATDNDEYYYEVVTRFWESSTTRINRLDPESGKMIPKAELLKDEDSRDAPYTGLKFIDPDKPDAAPISPDSFLGLGDAASKNAYAFSPLYCMTDNVRLIIFLQFRKIHKQGRDSVPMARIRWYHRGNLLSSQVYFQLQAHGNTILCSWF